MKSGNQKVFFQSREGSNLSGRIQAIEFLQKNNYSEEKTKAFATSPIFMKECKEDPLLPERWKYKMGKVSNCKNVFMFLPPSSLNFMGRHAVLEYIKKNNADVKDTEKIERFLKTMCLSFIQGITHGNLIKLFLKDGNIEFQRIRMGKK